MKKTSKIAETTAKLIALGMEPEAAAEAAKLGLTASSFIDPAAAIEKAHADHQWVKISGPSQGVTPKRS